MQWQASRRTLMLGALIAASGLARSSARAADAHHAIAMHGEPAWAPDFDHPTYANPAAPKGGQLVQGVLGTFDSLNPFIVMGLPAANIRSYVSRACSRAAMTSRSRFTACSPTAWRPMPREATSPSRSIRRRVLPTANR